MKHLLILLFCTPVWAETLSPEEFEAMSTGKTLYFTQDGQPYGAEQFFKNRRSLWMDSNGQCVEGVWFAEDNLICFNYKDQFGTQCWTMVEKDGGFSARPEGGTEADDIDLSHTDTKPLNCPGPAVGV